MNNSTTIRRLISALLIIIFALSITPVVILHAFTANHKDISYRNKNVKQDQYSKAGINCHCIDFVAEAQYLNWFSPFDFTIQTQFPAFNGSYKKSFYCSHHFYAELRGPPAIA